MESFIFYPFFIPFVLFVSLAFIKARSKFSTIVNLLIVGLYVFIIYKRIIWVDYGSYYLRYLYIILYLLACIKPIQRIHLLPIFYKSWIGLTLKFLIVIYLLNPIIKIIDSSYKEVPTIQLDFPLKNGTYYINHGGKNKITNPHPVDEYAMDIVKMNSFGKIWKGWSYYPPDLKEDYLIFGDTVYSPCNGVIIEVIDGHVDHEVNDNNNLNANLVKIRPTGTILEIALVHLMKNSILVKEGDRINSGDPIGLVGNSGISFMPHLHIDVTDKNNKSNSIFGESIFPIFNNRILIRNTILRR